jgi:hypothetical protein
MLAMTTTEKTIKAISKIFPLLNEAIYRADVIRSVGIAAHMFLPYSGRK